MKFNRDIIITIGGVFIFYCMYETMNDVVKKHARAYHEEVMFRFAILLYGLVLITAYDNNGDCWPNEE